MRKSHPNLCHGFLISQSLHIIITKLLMARLDSPRGTLGLFPLGPFIYLNFPYLPFAAQNLIHDLRILLKGESCWLFCHSVIWCLHFLNRGFVRQRYGNLWGHVRCFQSKVGYSYTNKYTADFKSQNLLTKWTLKWSNINCETSNKNGALLNDLMSSREFFMILFTILITFSRNEHIFHTFRI